MSTRPTSQGYLPQELIETILDELNTSLPDIKTCSLLNHDWLDAARRRIFSTISVPCSKGRHVSTLSGMTRTSDTMSVERVFNSILAIQHLDMFLTRLVLDFNNSVALLRYSQPFFESLTFPKLRELKVSRFRFDGGGGVGGGAAYVEPFIQILGRNPSVEVLSFEFCEFRLGHSLPSILLDRRIKLPRLGKVSFRNWIHVSFGEREVFEVIDVVYREEEGGEGEGKGKLELVSSDDRAQADWMIGCMLPCVCGVMDMDFGGLRELEVKNFSLNRGYGDLLERSCRGTLRSVSIDVLSRDQHCLFDIISETCPGITNLKLRFNSISCGLDVYLSSPSKLHPLHALQSLEELTVKLDVEKEDWGLVWEYVFERLDRELEEVVRSIGGLRSVLIVVPGKEKEMEVEMEGVEVETVFPRTCAVRRGVLQMSFV